MLRLRFGGLKASSAVVSGARACFGFELSPLPLLQYAASVECALPHTIHAGVVQIHSMFVVCTWYAFGGTGSLRLAHAKDPVGDMETLSMTGLAKLVGRSHCWR